MFPTNSQKIVIFHWYLGGAACPHLYPYGLYFGTFENGAGGAPKGGPDLRDCEHERTYFMDELSINYTVQLTFHVIFDISPGKSWCSRI